MRHRYYRSRISQSYTLPVWLSRLMIGCRDPRMSSEALCSLAVRFRDIYLLSYIALIEYHCTIVKDWVQVCLVSSKRSFCIDLHFMRWVQAVEDRRNAFLRHRKAHFGAFAMLPCRLHGKQCVRQSQSYINPEDLSPVVVCHPVSLCSLTPRIASAG